MPTTHLDEPGKDGHGGGFAAHACSFCLLLVSIAPRARFRLALQGYSPPLASHHRAVDLPFRAFGTALKDISGVLGGEGGNFSSGHTYAIG